jgi:hypothetical protein
MHWPNFHTITGLPWRVGKNNAQTPAIRETYLEANTATMMMMMPRRLLSDWSSSANKFGPGSSIRGCFSISNNEDPRLGSAGFIFAFRDGTK